MKSLVLKIASIPWLQHLVFWVLSIAFITSYFAISSEYSSTDLIYSLCFHLCLIPMVYIQLRLVIPNLFQKERYLFFFISSIMVVLFGWIIHFITFEYLVPNLLKSFYIVSFTENTILFGILTIYLILATLLHFSKSWFRVNALEKDKINMELNALSSNYRQTLWRLPADDDPLKKLQGKHKAKGLSLLTTGVKTEKTSKK